MSDFVEHKHSNMPMVKSVRSLNTTDR